MCCINSSWFASPSSSIVEKLPNRAAVAPVVIVFCAKARNIDSHSRAPRSDWSDCTLSATIAPKEKEIVLSDGREERKMRRRRKKIVSTQSKK